jgi:hypothetical protein
MGEEVISRGWQMMKRGWEEKGHGLIGIGIGIGIAFGIEKPRSWGRLLATDETRMKHGFFRG